MDAFLFYAYWNGAQVRDLFEALVSITTRGSYAQMAALLFLIGIVIVLAAGAARHEGRPAVTYFACAILFWCAAVVPRVTVAVQDVRTQAVYTVDNVPLGIGFFGSVANRMGYWLTELYETAFAPVEAARFSRFGAVYPERIVEVLQSTGPITVEGAAALKAAVEGCIAPEVLTDPAKAARLSKSVDLWQEVSSAGWVNPARLAAMPNGQVMRCPEALAYVDEVLRTIELPALKGKLGARLAPDHAVPEAVIASSIPQAEELLLNLSRTMDSSLRHSLMLTSLPAVLSAQAAQAEGPLGAAVTLARAQGNLASEINYRTMAKIAQDALPKIRNALEFVVIGMFPVIVLVALVSGSAMGSIVRSYLTLLAAVQIWPALSSIVNHLMIACDAHPFGVIAAQFGGNSLQAVSLIRETGATSQAIAGALMCAVPVIAYALVRAGDVAVGQLVGGLSAPAQSAASAQGGALAAGNISQGNVQVSNVQSNNASANKFDRSISTAHPGTVVSTTAYGSVTRSSEGVVTGMSRTAVNLGVSSATTQSFARSHASSNLSQISSLWTDAARFSFSQSASSSDATQRSFAHALHNALQTEMGYGSTHSVSMQTGTSMENSRGIEMSSADSVSEGMKVSSGGKVGGTYNAEIPSKPWNPTALGTIPLEMKGPGSETLGKPKAESVSENEAEFRKFPVRAGIVSGSTGLTFDDAQSLLDQAINRSGTTTSGRQSEAYEHVRNALDRVASSHRNESVRQAARSFADSLNAARTSSREEGRTVASSITAASAVSQNIGSQASTVVDGSIGVMNEAINRFATPEAALREMFASRAEGMHLGGKIADDNRFGAGPQDAFGPGTMVSAREMNQGVLESAKADLRAVAGDFSSRIPRELQAEEIGPAPDVSTVRGAVQERQDEVRGRMTSAGSNLDFERGVLMVAQDAYKKESSDKNFALRNAFMFAWGYRSGEEIQDDMRERAADMPLLREKLEQIGRSDKDELDERDWRGLVELARQPRGLR